MEIIPIMQLQSQIRDMKKSHLEQNEENVFFFFALRIHIYIYLKKELSFLFHTAWKKEAVKPLWV